MKERPILFSGPMVRAILDGRKTQTRRIIKTSARKGRPQFTFGPSLSEAALRKCKPRCRNKCEFIGAPPNIEINLRFPFGLIGSRIWVRETWRTRKEWDNISPKYLPVDLNKPDEALYSADDARRLDYVHYEAQPEGGKLHGKLRPSIFMCRWMSRITLEITDVRVERLNEITEEDAKAEGVTPSSEALEVAQFPHTELYMELWDSINGAGFWAQNPWVWVIEFKRIVP